MRVGRKWTERFVIGITLLASQPIMAADELRHDSDIVTRQLKPPSDSINGKQQTPPSSPVNQNNSQADNQPLQDSQSSGNNQEAERANGNDGADAEQTGDRPPVIYQPAGFAASPLPAPPVLPEGGDRTADTEPGEILVVTASMAAAKEAAQVFERFGMRVIRRRLLNTLGLVLSTFRLPEDRAVSNILAELRRALPEAWVDVNHHYRLQAAASNPHPRTYARALLNWPSDPPACSHDRRLGLVDTGVARQHPALPEARIESRSFLPAGVEPAAADHGTAVAELLIGNADSDNAGLVSRSRLYAASVFHAADEEAITTSERVVLALDWLVGNEVEAINLSLAGSNSLILELAVRRVHESGVRMIAAAGNDSRNKEPVYPAAYSHVIAVTAVDAETMIYAKAGQGDYVDFAAPGVDVWTASARGGRYVSGTSFAVPFVTAALLLAEPLRLQQQVRDLGEPGRDPVYGHGLVQYPGCP